MLHNTEWVAVMDPATVPATMREMLQASEKVVVAPRPLALHLAIQNLMFVSSLIALPSLKDGSLHWKAPLDRQAKALRESLENVDPGLFAEAVGKEFQSRLSAFAAGINRFAKARRRPSLPQLPVVWDEGTTRVVHAESAGAPVILIPSLINRAYILDLSHERSLLRYLAERGLDTYLVDWDAPGETEKTFRIDDYVQRLARIRDHVIKATGQKPMLVGYCMGGNLALALAHLDTAKIARLALLATPWDFHAMAEVPTRMLAAMMPALRHVIEVFGELPVDVMQAMFSSRDPSGAIRKFRQFAGLDPESEAAQSFIELEDWLNDGVALVRAVALECLEDWYLENRPMTGRWEIAGRPVDPRSIALPSLLIVPSRDTIVPPASALPLAGLLPNARLIELNAGHIGMMAGSKAVDRLYGPLADWLGAGEA